MPSHVPAPPCVRNEGLGMASKQKNLRISTMRLASISRNHAKSGGRWARPFWALSFAAKRRRVARWQMKDARLKNKLTVTAKLGLSGRLLTSWQLSGWGLGPPRAYTGGDFTVKCKKI